MDTHSQQADHSAYLRGMPASDWTEATTGHQPTSGTTAQPSAVDKSNAPSDEDRHGEE